MKSLNNINKYKAIWSLDENNSYPLFLYIASLLDYIEYDNGGCLTMIGMNILKTDISPYIQQFQTEHPKITQKNLVQFLLNILNSYTISVLVKQFFELCRYCPDIIFEKTDFPPSIKDDFDKLESKVTELIPKLKTILETYFYCINEKCQAYFLDQKTKSFVKQIYISNFYASLEIKFLY